METRGQVCVFVLQFSNVERSSTDDESASSTCSFFVLPILRSMCVGSVHRQRFVLAHPPPPPPPPRRRRRPPHHQDRQYRFDVSTTVSDSVGRVCMCLEGLVRRDERDALCTTDASWKQRASRVQSAQPVLAHVFANNIDMVLITSERSSPLCSRSKAS